MFVVADGSVLLVVCCLLRVVRYLLFVGCWLLCCSLVAVCSLLVIG